MSSAAPKHLEDWLAKQGKKLDDYRDVISDAGTLVPGISLATDGV